jgi:hypothetical protein
MGRSLPGEPRPPDFHCLFHCLRTFQAEAGVNFKLLYCKHSTEFIGHFESLESIQVDCVFKKYLLPMFSNLAGTLGFVTFFF